MAWSGQSQFGVAIRDIKKTNDYVQDRASFGGLNNRNNANLTDFGGNMKLNVTRKNPQYQGRKPIQHPRNSSINRDNNNNGGLIRIENAHEGMSNVTVVGVISAKESPRNILSKKDSSERYVLNLVLRDSPGGFVNVSCWGGEQYIKQISDNFGVGDIVQLSNFNVQPKVSDRNEDRYRPSTPLFSLSENHGTISMYGGWDLDKYSSLLRLPTKANNDFYTLEDVMANADSLEGEHINLFVVVKKVGLIKDITTKSGKKTQRCEIKVFDDTFHTFPIVLWDKEQCQLTTSWIPFETVLFVADIRVSYDNFRSSMLGTADSKTIFTVNPDTPVAYSLYQFAETQKVQEEDEDQPYSDPPLESIQDEYDITSVKSKIREGEMKPASLPLYGIMNCFLSQFDIDSDTYSIVRLRCEKCSQTLPKSSGYVCTNPECSDGVLSLFDPSMNTESYAADYNIPVNFTDHTGTIENCHIYDPVAEEMLGIQAKNYSLLDAGKKTQLKWKYLLEKVKVYFKLTRGRGDSHRVNLRVLSCSLVSPNDIYPQKH